MHHEKSFVPLLITYLITLSLEKKTRKSLEFWIQKSAPTLYDTYQQFKFMICIM